MGRQTSFVVRKSGFGRFFELFGFEGFVSGGHDLSLILILKLKLLKRELIKLIYKRVFH